MRGDDVRSLLEEATTRLPPSAVSASLAVRTARRQRRIRRRLVCLSMVVVPVVVVILLRTCVPSVPVRWTSAATPMSGFPLAEGNGDATGTGDATSTGTGTTATSPAVDDRRNTLLATGFDPLRRTLRVGWVPHTVVEEWWELESHRQEYTGLEARDAVGVADGFDGRRVDRGATVDGDEVVLGGEAGLHNGGGLDEIDELGDEADATSGVVVTVLAPGRNFSLAEPVLGMVSWSTRTAPAVQGHPALCVAERGDDQSCPVLRWQPEPDVWVSVGYVTDRRMTRSEVAMVTRRVAESVSLDAPESVRLPFWISGHTATFVPRRAVVRGFRTGAAQVDRPRWSAGLVLDDGVPVDAASSLRRTVAIQVSDAGTGAIDFPPKGMSTTVVAGQEVSLDADQGFLTAGADGALVVVRTTPGQADDVFGDLRVVEGPDRTELWTDVPLA
jgi:hypothetical protein